MPQDHELYEELSNSTFHNGERDAHGSTSSLYDNVVLGGLSVRRRCGRYEGELGEPCAPRA